MWFQIISKCFFESAFSYFGKNVLSQGIQHVFKQDDYGDYVFISCVNNPNEAFYNNQDLLDYKDDTTLCFIAYIGIHNKEPMFKYGISQARHIHKYFALFSTFYIVYLRQIHKNENDMEKRITEELKQKYVYRELMVMDLCVGEIFAVSPSFSFEKIRTMIDRMIEHLLFLEFQELSHENTNLRQKINDKEELIDEQRNTIGFLKNMIQHKE